MKTLVRLMEILLNLDPPCAFTFTPDDGKYRLEFPGCRVDDVGAALAVAGFYPKSISFGGL